MFCSSLMYVTEDSSKAPQTTSPGEALHTPSIYGSNHFLRSSIRLRQINDFGLLFFANIGETEVRKSSCCRVLASHSLVRSLFFSCSIAFSTFGILVAFICLFNFFWLRVNTWNVVVSNGVVHQFNFHPSQVF